MKGSFNVITQDNVVLNRDCDAIEIPVGTKLTLRKGEEVTIMQSLGGAYTVMTENGLMVRIPGAEADAIGKEPVKQIEVSDASLLKDPNEVEKLVWEQLKTCYDPEIPVSIVELGLVYLCRVTPLEGGGNKAQIDFTLTAPGCGMGDILKLDIEDKVKLIPGIKEVDVQVLVDQMWDPSRMSEAARLELGMF